ncbi:ionotropic receptor 93a [Chelonus insularis]|uniref:ionotropic receptor 93a n=1 Tax=Chelonus insularis TaxID=460826 RepID=UPI00158E2BEB|nr:ionotropic receptor 93a [Chelonus insularis]
MDIFIPISLLFLLKFVTCFTDFPSLMIANATMVFIIERPFYERKILFEETGNQKKDSYERSVATFTGVLTKVVREKMKTTGLLIVVYDDIETNLARDYTIILSVATCSTTWRLFRRARKEKLVHLALTDSNCPRLPNDGGISIPLIQPGKELPQIFYDLRNFQQLKWNQVHIIYDEVVQKDEIGQVSKAFTNDLFQSKYKLATHYLYFLKTASSNAMTKHRLKKLLGNFPRFRSIDENFLIIISYKLIPLFLECARVQKMLHPDSQWLFVIPDMPENLRRNISFLQDYLEEGENIAFLYNKTNLKNIQNNEKCRNKPVCYAKEIVGALAIAIENALSMEIELFNSTTEEEFESLGITKSTRSKEIIKLMRSELFNGTRLLNHSVACGQCIKWILVSALTWGNRIGPDSQFQAYELKETGIWMIDSGFKLNDHIFPHIINGFLGKSLPVVTYHNPPWQFKKIKQHSTGVNETKWDGFIFDIMEELSRVLNFTLKIIVIDSSPEIMASKNDTKKSAMSAAEKVPDEVTALVRKREVFMAACAYTNGIYHDDTALNFTIPLTVQTYGLLTPKPKPLSRVLLFTMPYSMEAWACIASSIILVGPILFIVHAYSPRRDYDPENPLKENLGTLASPLKCMWYIYGALLQQGGMNLPKTDGARLIVGTWWLVVMIIVATYSGSLVAFLTFPKMEATILTIDDLLQRQAEFTWSLPAGSFFETFLSINNNEDILNYRQLLPDHEPHAEKHNTVSYRKNIERVKKEKHAVIDWTNALKISARNEYINDGVCHFALGTNILALEEPIAMIVPAHSPYLNLINVQLRRMHESGLINKWIRSWISTKDECSDNNGYNQEASNHKVDLHDMQGIFFVLFFGYLISSIFLGFEFYRYQRKVAKERKLIHPFLE